MSDNPFEEDNNLDNNNLDNNLNSNLDSSNNLNVNSQKLTSSSAKSFNGKLFFIAYFKRKSIFFNKLYDYLFTLFNNLIFLCKFLIILIIIDILK